MAVIKNKVIPTILGLKGFYLTKEEIKLISKNQIYGFIFFKRNILNLEQLKNLINHIKILSINKPIIMIDHEGGRVNRFKDIFNQKKYTSLYFGNLYRFNKKKFLKEARYFVNFNVNIFKFLGINTVAYPVADLTYKKTHNVIGDRSFSNQVSIVNKLSKFFINEYQKNGINCISKHVPGHGLSIKDSHSTLPVVKETYHHLLNNDFKCFENLNSKFIMTAHIKYKSIDNKLATYSKKIISIIRKKIKFTGIIMTDDICMKALKESLSYKISQPLLAGCDIILHCNGNINEMKKIISILNK